MGGLWCGSHPALESGPSEDCITQGHPVTHYGSRHVLDLLLTEIVEANG
jgi:hypothetical protein